MFGKRSHEPKRVPIGLPGRLPMPDWPYLRKNSDEICAITDVAFAYAAREATAAAAELAETITARHLRVIVDEEERSTLPGRSLTGVRLGLGFSAVDDDFETPVGFADYRVLQAASGSSEEITRRVRGDGYDLRKHTYHCVAVAYWMGRAEASIEDAVSMY